MSEARRVEPTTEHGSQSRLICGLGRLGQNRGIHGQMAERTTHVRIVKTVSETVLSKAHAC